MDESYKEKIQSYLSGDMEESESVKFEKFLAESQEMQNYMKDSESVWDLLDSTEKISPDNNYITRFWNTVSEKEENENKGVLNIFEILWNRKLTFAVSFTTFFIIGALVVNFYFFDHSGSTEYVYDKADEELLDNLDRAITLNTPEYLQVYGPWDE